MVMLLNRHNLPIRCGNQAYRCLASACAKSKLFCIFQGFGFQDSNVQYASTPAQNAYQQPVPGGQVGQGGQGFSQPVASQPRPMSKAPQASMHHALC